MMLISLGSACFAVLFLAPTQKRSNWAKRLFLGGKATEPVWLFDGDFLLDQSSAARALSPDGKGVETWETLYPILSERFADLPEDLAQMQEQQPRRYEAKLHQPPADLFVEDCDGILRIHISMSEGENWQNAHARNLRTDLRQTQNYLDLTPYPMWRTNADGKICWVNRAYLQLARTTGLTNEMPVLFALPPDGNVSSKLRRQCLTAADTKRPIWFEVSRTQYDDVILWSATNIDAVVSAEIAQRNFVQTLAKTFAQLSSGLAIFDRKQQLALFNPALIDLTGLPADFLSARPDVLTFFDRMRENRIIPEPKDYRSWRNQISELIAAANDGEYQETWSLPSGSVYQVSGRPHPDGAIALLFEDITAEISLTRRFRADIELIQSTLNQVDDAIAVFSSSGGLLLTNAAYRKLWAVDPDSSFAETTILDETRNWQNRCKATPLWGEVRDFVSASQDRATWGGNVGLKDGTATLSCTISPIQTGATMVSFRPKPTPQTTNTPLSDQRTGEPV